MHPSSWPSAGSTQAGWLAQDWLVFTCGALALALVVWALIIVAAVRFRHRPGNLEPRSQNANNTRLEIAWTVVPLVIVLGLFAYTYRIEAAVETVVPAPPVHIAVTGFRWGWTFAYRGGPTISGTSANPPTLVLPADETAQLDVTSSDVIHSFWIPDMLFKRDAVPGRVSSFDLTPNKLGTFAGACGEFCGLNHALMTFRVRVVSSNAYAQWRARPATE